MGTSVSYLPRQEEDSSFSNDDQTAPTAVSGGNTYESARETAGPQALTNSYRREKVLKTIQVIKHDLKGADMKVSLYLAAFNAVDKDFTLRPFPPGFHPCERFDEDKLIAINSEIPAPQLMPIYLLEKREFLSKPAQGLLQWLFLTLFEPRLTTVPLEDFSMIFHKVNSSAPTRVPSYIFRLLYRSRSTSETKWETAKSSMPTKFAFYTNNVCMFHSLIHFGFAAVNTSQNPFVRLTSDINAVIQEAPSEWTWGKSQIGHQLSIAAIVEYIDDPKSITANSSSPNDFYITDPNNVRIRYLMVYVSQGPSHLRPGRVRGSVPVDIGKTSMNIILALFLLMVLVKARSNPAMVGIGAVSNKIAEKAKFWS